MVLVTCPNRKIGETIGHILVQERLAACVNVVLNLTSIPGCGVRPSERKFLRDFVSQRPTPPPPRRTFRPGCHTVSQWLGIPETPIGRNPANVPEYLDKAGH